jgi:TM2 domain-containing membrane protein YozV
MLDSALLFLDRLCGAKGARGIISSILFIIISVSLLVFYENYTRHFFLNRMAKEVELLQNLENLRPNYVNEQNEKIISTYKTEILEAITSKKHTHQNIRREDVIKYFVNFSLSMVYWFALAVSIYNEEKKKKGNKDTAIVMLIFGVILSFITSFFQRRIFIIGHLLLYPTIMIVAIVVIGLIITSIFSKPKQNNDKS